MQRYEAPPLLAQTAGIGQARPIPAWIQETLMRNLVADLKEQKWVSVSNQSRMILDLAKNSNIALPVTQTANRAVTLMERAGFSERNCLLAHQERLDGYMAKKAKREEKSKPACPEGMVEQLANGTCPPGFVKEGKCCRRFQKLIKTMDQRGQELMAEVRSDQRLSPEEKIQLHREFADIFGMDGESKARKETMVQDWGMSGRTYDFMQKSRQEDEEALLRDLEASLQGSQAYGNSLGGRTMHEASVKAPHVVAGMPEASFRYLHQNKFNGDLRALAKYRTNFDWSRWFIAIFVFRSIALLMCFYLRADSFMGAFSKWVQAGFGLAVMGTNGLIVLLATMFLNAIIHFVFGTSLTAILGSALDWVVGRFLNVEGFHLKLMSFLQKAGLAAELYYIVGDLWAMLKGAGQAVVDNISNPLAIPGEVVKGAAKAYCDRHMQTFLSQVGEKMQSFSVGIMQTFCAVLGRLVGSGTSISVCNALLAVMQTFQKSMQVAKLMYHTWSESTEVAIENTARKAGNALESAHFLRSTGRQPPVIIPVPTGYTGPIPTAVQPPAPTFIGLVNRPFFGPMRKPG